MKQLRLKLDKPKTKPQSENEIEQQEEEQEKVLRKPNGVQITKLNDYPVKFQNSDVSSEIKVPIDKDIFGMSFRSD